MDTIKTTGESSCRGRENGDASTDPKERPLKKARFAWQVKGKYHLKNETNESNRNLLVTSTEPSTSKPASMIQSSSSTFGSEVKDWPIKQNGSKLDSVTNSDNSLLTPNNSITRKQPQYPRSKSTNERTSAQLKAPDIAEKQCIAQWQIRQVVKGCLDNAMNLILEAGQGASLRILAQGFAEFFNHLPGDNSIENEAILMAISAHGLQNASGSSSRNNTSDRVGISSTLIHDNLPPPPPIQSLSPIGSDNDSQPTNVQQCITEAGTEKEEWKCDKDEATPFAYLKEPSPSPRSFYDVNNQNPNTNSLEIDSHYDLMNAAVLYAIKSKGLTASGPDYG